MKLICHREGLLSACQSVSVAVAARNVNPVLQNLKVSTEGDRCTLMATDTEVGIRMEVRSVNVEEPGDALLPANRLLAILREATEEEVTIETDGSFVPTIKGRRFEYELPGEDPTVFPDFPVIENGRYHEINSKVLEELVRRTTFAVANPEKTTKWTATSGILWELDGGKVKLVGTDGRRLALCEGTGVSVGEHRTGNHTVVPLKAMQLLEKNLEDNETVRVSFRPNEVLVKTERATIYSRLVEGRFPNYQQALPKAAGIRVPLTAGTFLKAVRQAAVMVSEESAGVIFSFEPGKVTLKARGNERGKSRVELDLDYAFDPLEISFDPRYVSDMLKVFDGETEFSLELSSGDQPAVFRRQDYAYVVLPLVVCGQEKAAG